MVLFADTFNFIYIEESQVDEKTKALKGKEDVIAQKEKVIQEKSDSIASLHSEIASLQVWNLYHCF